MDKTSAASGQDWSRWLMDPAGLGAAAVEYAVDSWQRTLLYADVRRERGNQYREHLRERAPNVLGFEAEPVLSGLDLPRPVNYGLARILPPEGMPTDPTKRPFVVVDPRAGHGPGIGGFKPDSEIGAALQAGHPCYFVGFLPNPVPGQTVEDVMRAEAAFVREVGKLHPDSTGKPAVIGNCQAGWQILMTAAVWPELFGPIIVAGAPLSYWAGDNPMRYGGGLTGGSWLTALANDLGAGRFDGAWLVQNFENLDPANTLWSKQYNVYAHVDTEAARYLGFEKYWGGHVLLDGGEMQYIVDNLFIGNKLATAELVTSDGVRIDLRDIRSPIVVFCSYGDNITPPGQALGWITDLYRDDRDLISHDQTIVYATHDSIGHLGIFVSSNVGRKEHRKLASNIDLIDMLPAGVFQAVVGDAPPGMEGELADDPFLLSIRGRSVEDVRAIVQPDTASERRFAAAARVSEINLALYRNFLQPWVRSLSTPWSARWLQSLHPMRTGYEAWSDEHPLAPMVAGLAKRLRQERSQVSPDNPFLQTEAAMSQAVEQFLDRYRDHRDQIYRTAFETIYGSPWMQALAGQSVDETTPPRPHPGDSPEHRAFIERTIVQLHALFDQGGLNEAGLRALTFVLLARGEADERLFRYAANLVQAHGGTNLAHDDVRERVRTQALLMRMDVEATISALPALLADATAEQIRATAMAVRDIVESGGALPANERQRLDRMLAIFETACSAATVRAQGLAKRKKAPAPPQTKTARRRAKQGVPTRRPRR
ncbi:DUF3141 domain-containing protein [Pseudoxanthomonas mexicana]